MAYNTKSNTRNTYTLNPNITYVFVNPILMGDKWGCHFVPQLRFCKWLYFFSVNIMKSCTNLHKFGKFTMCTNGDAGFWSKASMAVLQNFSLSIAWQNQTLRMINILSRNINVAAFLENSKQKHKKPLQLASQNANACKINNNNNNNIDLSCSNFGIEGTMLQSRRWPTWNFPLTL